MSEDQNKPNPNWVEAPLEVAVLFWVPRKPTRKKQLKASRRAFRKIKQSYAKTSVWHKDEYH